MENNQALGQHLPIDNVLRSNNNPRKHFDETKLAELAESIKEKGVIQPIVVRPIIQNDTPTGDYEIVAGERRYRASLLAGQATIPAVIRELSDLEAMQITAMENLQRSDLHPLGEAQSFHNLLKSKDNPDGWTAEDIGGKVGKSRAYIYASLKLLELCPEAQQAFYDDKLKRETAILIARIPGKKLQQQATKEIIRPDYAGESMSYRSAARMIHERFTLQLEKAPFDTNSKKLLPEVGDCKSCPKRSGNCTEICADIESPDVCTDPECFGEKKKAHIQILIDRGDKVISGKEADKIAPYGVNSYIDSGSGYASADSYANGLDVRGNWKELLGKDLPAPTIIIDKNNNTGKIYKIEELQKKVAEKLASGELRVKERKQEPASEWEIKRAAAEKVAAAEKARRVALFDQLHDKLENIQMQSTLFRFVMISVVASLFNEIYNEETVRIISKYAPDGTDAEEFLQTNVREMDAAGLVRLAAEIAAVGQVEISMRWEPSDDVDDPPAKFYGLLTAVGLDSDQPLEPAKPVNEKLAAIKAKGLAKSDKAKKTAKAKAEATA